MNFETICMIEQVADRINRLEESSTLKMARLTRELKAKGLDIINLSLGEPDFNTPDHIKQAAIQAINDNCTHYPPVSGYPDLRQAIADKFKRENELDYNASQIIVSNGAKQSIINVMLSLLQEGDEIIIPGPFWVSYPEMAKLAGATPVIVNTTIENNFKITPAELEAAITPRTKAMIFASPCNPSGIVYSKAELEGLADVFANHHCIFVISDEIYEHINYVGKHVSMAQIPSMYDQTIVINGVSKAFAMTGWRVGYMAAAEWIARACEKIQGQVTSGVNSIAQRATFAALTMDMTPTYQMAQAFKERRTLVLSKLKDIPGLKYREPEGAFYLLPDVSAYFGMTYNGEKINDADEMAMFLLEVAQISVVSGSGFGAPNCLRFSFAASTEDLTNAMERLKSTLAKLEI